MHSLVIVLLPPDTPDVRKAVSVLISPYRIDDENLDPMLLRCQSKAELDVVIARDRKRYKWDYWTIGPGWKEQYGVDVSVPPAIAGTLDEDLAMNVCPAGQLPAEIDCGAIVEPDGAWHEPEDFGWKMLNSPEKNAEPLRRWKRRSTDLLSAHRDCIAVLIDCHC